MLEKLLAVSENEAGILALFFGNMRSEYIAEITEKVIYAYYMLPEKVRKMKSKHSIVEGILKSEDLDLGYSVSSYEVCETLIDAYANNVVQAAIEEQKREEDEKREYITEYIDSSMKLLNLLKDMSKTWEANNGELNTHKSRKEYAEFMSSVIDNLDRNSYIGNSIITNLNNMTFLTQNIFLKHDDLRISEIPNGKKVNRNVAIELRIFDGERNTSKYKTVTEHFLECLGEMLHDPKLYNLQTLERLAEKWPNPSDYTKFHLMFLFMEEYATLYNIFFNKVIEKLNDKFFLEEVFNLCKRFPVEYDSDYKGIFMRDVDLTSIPYIEIEDCKYKYIGNCVGYAFVVGNINNYETRVVIVRFVNVNIEKYTANFQVIENRYLFTNSDKRCVDVEWGKWVESDALELKITRNNLNYDSEIGSFKIKVCVKQNPEIVAYIEGAVC